LVEEPLPQNSRGFASGFDERIILLSQNGSPRNGTLFKHQRFLDGHLQGRLPMLSTILVVVLILILIGALPTWGYSSGWGYGPGGLVGLLLIIVVVLALTGRI
jgi:hypothetical protein